MKLGWNITLTEDDYQLLHRIGEIATPFANVKKLTHNINGTIYGFLSIEFNEDQAPPRQLLEGWVAAFYDRNGPELERVNEEIRLWQMGKLRLASIPQPTEPVA